MQTSSASSYVERSNAYLYAAMPRIIAVIVMLSYTRFAFFCLGCDSVLPKNCRLLLLIFYLCLMHLLKYVNVEASVFALEAVIHPENF